VAGTALATALTACTAGEAESVRKEALVPQLAITPGDGALNVAAGNRIVVRAKNGTVRNVRVQTAGDPVTGRLSDHATAWQSLSPLNASRRFTVVATAVGSGGKIVTATSSFATLKPRKAFNAMTLEGYVQHYGVGMPIILNFSRPITRKAAIEKAIQIRTSQHVVGAWYWDGDKTLYFRPRTYWPQDTRVSFDARFNGVQGAPGVYGTHDLTQSFEIGRPADHAAGGTYLTINTGKPKVTKARSCCGGYWSGWLGHCLHRLWTHQELCNAAAELAKPGCKRGSGVVSKLDAAVLPRGGRWRPVCAA
jgi:hypothetical protein